MNIPWNSPCEKCGKDSEECDGYYKCPKWLAWFACEWSAIKKRFGVI